MLTRSNVYTEYIVFLKINFLLGNLVGTKRLHFGGIDMIDVFISFDKGYHESYSEGA